MCQKAQGYLSHQKGFLLVWCCQCWPATHSRNVFAVILTAGYASCLGLRLLNAACIFLLLKMPRSQCFSNNSNGSSCILFKLPCAVRKLHILFYMKGTDTQIMEVWWRLGPLEQFRSRAEGPHQWQDHSGHHSRDPQKCPFHRGWQARMLWHVISHTTFFGPYLRLAENAVPAPPPQMQSGHPSGMGQSGSPISGPVSGVHGGGAGGWWTSRQTWNPTRLTREGNQQWQNRKTALKREQPKEELRSEPRCGGGGSESETGQYSGQNTP